MLTRTLSDGLEEAGSARAVPVGDVLAGLEGARPAAVVVGGGCAGLALGVAAAARGLPLLVLEARTGDEDERTWCAWDTGEALLPEAASRSWDRWEVRTPTATATASDPAHPYRMVRATDYRAAARRRLAGSPVQVLEGVRASAADPAPGLPPVVDARGVPRGGRVPPGRLRLEQRFLGQWIRTVRPVFDVRVATLMDFAQSTADEVRFAYVLPVEPDLALVEHTVFARPGAGGIRFRDAIAAYVADRWGLLPDEWSVEGEEAGSIPMTDERPPGDGFGLRGGVARPSTGYAYLRIQRAARSAADALATGDRPAPLRDPLRTRLLDAVFLRFLRDRPDLAPAVFVRMFAALPGDLVVRFLTERSGALDDLRLILALPKRPFLRAALTAAVERTRALLP